MNLTDIVNRQPPEPWGDADKIPWDDPAFSARMLREHLSQEHDAASRRIETVDRHVRWIHEAVLGGRPSKVLDLGCGPGLYTSRLANLGHDCTGIDFSPASIDHARRQTTDEHLSCTYHQADIRTADYGSGYDLAMLIYGELNTFPPETVTGILIQARGALAGGGAVILETSTEASIRRSADRPSTWTAHKTGLFSDESHITLTEHVWHEAQRARTTRWHVVDAATGAVARYAETVQAYLRVELESLLEAAGFTSVERFPSLTGQPDPSQPNLEVTVGWAAK